MVDVAKVLDSRLGKGKVHPRTGHEGREGEKRYNNNNNNNNNNNYYYYYYYYYYKLQLGCHPVAVVILHVCKI